jgi:hypothetical protein
MMDGLIKTVQETLISTVASKFPTNEKNRKYAFWVVIVAGLALILGAVYLSKKSKPRKEAEELSQEETNTGE